MGQYFIVVNLDKKEFLDPQRCGDGMKVGQIFGRGITLKVLGYLLMKSKSNPFKNVEGEEPEMTGRWAGDRIAFVGDSDWGTGACFDGVFDRATDGKSKEYADVSFDMLKELFELQRKEDWPWFSVTDAQRILWWNTKEPGFEPVAEEIRNIFGELEPKAY